MAFFSFFFFFTVHKYFVENNGPQTVFSRSTRSCSMYPCIYVLLCQKTRLLEDILRDDKRVWGNIFLQKIPNFRCTLWFPANLLPPRYTHMCTLCRLVEREHFKWVKSLFSKVPRVVTYGFWVIIIHRSRVFGAAPRT